MNPELIDRIQVWRDTKAAALTLDVPPSRYYMERDLRGIGIEKGFLKTDISVEDADCLEVAAAMRKRGVVKPVVLVLADDLEAGGGVEHGSRAQEENLWRRTALCRTQLQTFYPLKGVSLIYSPAVPVLRASERKGYRWLEVGERWACDFIACPAIKYPERVPHVSRVEGDLSATDRDRLERKLRLILRVAALEGNDGVVLGAMGCGAWNCPPWAVAEVFRDVLPDFAGVFRSIIVAVLTTGARRGKKTLYEEFGDVMCST
jgi:uncharacterized protein (TIGR02452 family)